MAEKTAQLTLTGGASLYVGSGGIVNGATNAYTETITLTAGTLGAKAGWSSSQPMTLSTIGTTIKAADAAGVAHDITLSSVLSGSGGFTKSGTGALIFMVVRMVIAKIAGTESTANTMSTTSTIASARNSGVMCQATRPVRASGRRTQKRSPCSVSVTRKLRRNHATISWCASPASAMNWPL